MELELVKFEIAKLELKENDMLVFKYVGEIPELDAVECLAESLHSILPKGVTALILGSDNLEITKVTHEETLD